MDKMLITNRHNGNAAFDSKNDATEFAAAKEAGFNILPVSLWPSMTDDTAMLQDTLVFIRHHADQADAFTAYAKRNGAELLIPDYGRANEWYKVVPRDSKAVRWLGGRMLSYINIEHIDASEEANPKDYMADIRKVVDTIFEQSASDTDRMFIKSPGKRAFDAGLYTRKEARLGMLYAIDGIHGTVSELIYSQPMDIARNPTNNRREEYRCLIVGNACSSISIVTDVKRKRNYDDIQEFAQTFVEHFAGQLPNAYCLDVARLTTKELAVIEINDIAGTGFWPDNDIYKLYQDLSALK